MKKVLSICACGLLLALVIGAAAWDQSAMVPVSSPVFKGMNKCVEVHEGVKKLDQDCYLKLIQPQQQTGERFLREKKRRVRKAFASL